VGPGPAMERLFAPLRDGLFYGPIFPVCEARLKIGVCHLVFFVLQRARLRGTFDLDLPFGPSVFVMSALAQARGERTLVPPNGIGTASSPSSATSSAMAERTAQRPGGDPITPPGAFF